MGLDMYLRDKETGIELMYWRKANQIRQWFISHIEDFNFEDNLGHYDVSKELLQELVDDIDGVLSDPAKASHIIPTSSGFFFGDTDYDELYFEQLKSTKERIQELLDDWQDGDEVYYTEWW